MNMLEEIKRSVTLEELVAEETLASDEAITPETETVGRRIKQKYEKLGLVPQGVLPNPLVREVCDFVRSKLSGLNRRLIELLKQYARDFGPELEIEGITGVLQEQMGMTNSLTLGIEFAGSAARAQAGAVQPTP